MTVTMQALTVITVLLLATSTTAYKHKECITDDECGSEEFCYQTNICTTFLNCTWYLRAPGSEPARYTYQCGPCLPGYSAEEISEDAVGGNKEADHCNKDPTDVPTITDNIPQAAIWAGVVVVVIVICCVLYWVHGMIRCKPCRSSNAEPEQLPMNRFPALTDVIASAPPPDMIQKNNNEYFIPEEARLLHYNKSKIEEEKPCHPSFAHSRTVRAQPCHPPDWVQPDPSYNPLDNSQVVGPSALETDEDTMTSSWTPGESNAIPEHPFAGINAEHEQNRTNTVLARLTCPSPSTSTDGNGNRQSNGTTGNSGNSPRGNINLIQIQVNNIVDQSGNGS